MIDLKDTKRGGFYWEEKTPYLSTTEIIKAMDKPALRYWFGREVWRAMAIDPTMDEKTALAKPYELTEGAKRRGRTVDDITQMIEQKEVAPEYQKYADAYWQFIKDIKPELITQQQTLFDKENMTGGTLDKYWKIGDKYHVTDIKTGKDIYKEVILQLSNYAHMLRLNDKRVDEISVLLLEVGEDGLATGKYKFHTLVEDFEAFLACKKVYEFMNKEKLIKFGYLK